MILKCPICKFDYDQRDMELSHDIPRYLGGTDLDGGHWLSENCHDKYERMILARCYLEIFNKIVPYYRDRRRYIPFMTSLKDNPRAKEIAFQIQKEVYGDGNSNP